MPRVIPLDATLGARITGIDLADLGNRDWKVVLDAFHEHAVLLFPGQNVDEAAQVAFAERFGRVEVLRQGLKAVAISNVRPDGGLLEEGATRLKSLRGNEGWHTDSSYMPLAAKASILAAQVVPEAGGETELADMRAAYEALDPDTRDTIENLAAHHSLYASQARLGYVFKTGDSYGYHTSGAPLRPLVKTHPVTGRRSLFIGRHAYRIPGMTDEEAEALLDRLLDRACRPPRTYTHRWRAGDVLMWDNRCVLHRARPYDDRQPRVLRHVRVAGEPASELAATGPDERADRFEPSAVNTPGPADAPAAPGPALPAEDLVRAHTRSGARP